MSEEVKTEEMPDFEEDEFSVYRKLFWVQTHVKAIAKDTKNKSQGFDYTSSTAVLVKIRSLMDEVGLLLLFSVKEMEVMRDAAYKGKQALTTLMIEATWVDVDNPSSRVTLLWPGHGADDGEKGVGKAMTYGEKYGLLKFFHIPTDDVDPDADAPPEDENAPKCSKCGKRMVIRDGKNGEFWACPGYPDCKNTMPIGGEPEVTQKSKVTTSKTRPEDGGGDALRKAWDATWDVVTQVRGVDKGDKKTVEQMKKWARRQTDGKIDNLADWPIELVIAFRGVVDKQAEGEGGEY